MNDIHCCPGCARPYRVYGHYCGDQSRCPGCRRDRDAEVERLGKEGWPPLEQSLDRTTGLFVQKNCRTHIIFMEV